VRTPMIAKSKGALPFVMDPPAAAARIVRELPAAPATIDFPWQLATVARLGAALPRVVRDRVLGVAAGRRPSD
jgi:hypothetical protein